MRPPTDNLPEPLRVVGATDLERRLITAAAAEQPSAELSQRMAAAIGVAAALTGIAAGTAATATAAAGKGAATSSLLLPAISVGVVALAMGGFLVLRGEPSAPPARTVSPPPAARATPAPVLAPAPPEPPAPTEAPSSVATASAQGRPIAAATDPLRDQIALLDGARAALAAKAAHRGLDLVRRYQARYPRGSFAPEADALRIEALLQLGRRAEAETRAERFAAEHGPSPLAERVARLVQQARR